MEHMSKPEAFRQGVIIFIFLAVLTALEFFIAIAIGAVILLAVIAVVKVSLVGYYYMHIYKLSQESVEDRESQEYKTGSLRLGLWLFLLSDSFLFGALAIARFNLLGLTRLPLN